MKTHAFPIQFAKEAILREQYTTALDVLKPLSRPQANLEAQFLHAYLHFWDDNLSRLEAIQQLERIAEQGHAEANYILAICPDLEAGYQFTLPTNAKQFDYLQRAVDAGSIYALADLAECHLTGIIENGDLQDLRTRLLKAFEMMSDRKRYPKLRFYLGKMLIEGLGGAVEIEKGIRTSGGYTKNENQHYVLESINLAIETLVNLDGAFPNSDGILTNFKKNRDNLSPISQPLWLSYLHDYCRRTLAYDLRDADFDTYCDFVFDHYVNLRHDFKTKRWDYYAEVTFDAQKLLHFYIELFHNSLSLQKRYSINQIVQGFGSKGIRGWNDWTVGCVMAHPDTVVDDVVTCIQSMGRLFEDLFRRTDFLSTGFMWWDIGYGSCGYDGIGRQKPREYSEEDIKRINQKNFLVMVEVLNMDSLHCQKAAIHGLGHSKHYEKELVLLEYLDTNPDLPASLREYALDAIKGRIM